LDRGWEALRKADFGVRELLFSWNVIAVVNSYDINVTHLASALRSNADDAILSNVISDAQPMRIKHCCSSDLLAGCGVV